MLRGLYTGKILAPNLISQTVMVLLLGTSLTLFHMGGGADSVLLQNVFFITSIRDAAETRNLVTFPKILNMEMKNF